MAILAILASPVLAQNPTPAAAGVLSFDGHWTKLKNRNGETQSIEFSDKTTYVGVVSAERSAIKTGVFVGIANVKGSGGSRENALRPRKPVISDATTTGGREDLECPNVRWPGDC